MMSIKYWPQNERPREKLLERGRQALSDAELLAILFRTGRGSKTAVDLAREQIQRFKGLAGLLEADRKRFCELSGVGVTAYVQLQAALELSRRYLSSTLEHQDLLTNPQQTKRFVASQLQHETRELFACLYLNAKNHLIAFEPLFYGTLHQAQVYPREIIKQALNHNASAVILSHNHPSGCAEPSQSDRQLTQQIQKALNYVDIKLHDHLVVGRGAVVSLAERGWLG